jgi:AraC family transcriptional regulator of adaptative response/methylated-DNA-[protein]-cysteine methyltransferase
VASRDRSADGAFVYAVDTTGVYCRPTCPSRRALPEHVTFHDSPTAAEAAGFRACKRCHPASTSADQAQCRIVERLCRLIETSDTAPALAVLARFVGLSPTYVHRLFTRMTGVTPKQYGCAARADRVTSELDAAPSVTAAVYAAGFASPSGFYRTASATLGMTPRAYRAGAAALPIRFSCSPCSLGTLLVAVSERGVCTISLGDGPRALERELRHRFPRATVTEDAAQLADIVATVIGIVEQPGAPHRLPLDIQGTAFQQRVWQALRTIPSGSTASYGEIARRIGSPTAARAVATACAANALAIVIPCHRVVRGSGSLSGYRWGVERKWELLERERAAAAR